jgi:2-dehydro-3-deoxyphosphogluconate aldolase / (4S)-4-hydroxy-2-oxoglutarate aldolase
VDCTDAERPAHQENRLTGELSSGNLMAMSNRKRQLLAAVERHVIIGVVREDRASDAWEIARAYLENGLRTIEITLTTPEAFSLIEKLRSEYDDQEIVIAAGTVRNGNDAADARRAGALALVSPHTDLRVIEYAAEHDLLCIPGAATPTEIIRAWEAGGDLIKVYPVPLLGGPDYIRTVRQPIRDVRMLAGGPVKIEEIEAYLDAGAVAMNLGGSLSVASLVADKKWDEIGRRAARAVAIIDGRPASSDRLAVH